MPELPEVETVCRGLRQSVIGKKIETAILRRANIRSVIPVDLPERVRNAAITRVERRAKYILIYLDNGETLLIHLGMSGRITTLSQHPASFDKHDHVVFLLNDAHAMIYHDPRRFGVVTIDTANQIAFHPLLSQLGWEPLSDAFTAEALYDALQKRKQAIKPALMDQQLVVGVGNIYAAESLFRAKISPLRTANSITSKEAEILVPHIKQVLRDAIESGGSTLRNYVDSRGESGYFQHHFDVYGKEHAPCPVCHSKIERITQAGRSTFWCSTCQK